MSNTYNAESIVKLKDRVHVRTNPGMYLGSGLSGAIQSVYEAVSNSVDEFLNGYGKKINITVKDDYCFIIEDEGRGIPVSFNETEQMSALELAVANLMSGGKSKAQEDKSYKVSGGTYGVGISAVNFISEYFIVTSIRDGYEWTMRFEDGIKTQELTQGRPNKKTGTIIEFKLDKKILKITDDFSLIELEKLIEMTSYMNKGLTLKVGEKEFKSLNGLKDKITKEVVDKNTNIFYVTEQDTESGINVELAFCWSSNKGFVNSYANTLRTVNGGSHETQFKTTLTRELNKIAKEKNLLKNEEVLSGEHIRSGLCAEISVSGSNFDLAGQTKDKLLTKEAGTAVNKILIKIISSISDAQLKKILLNAKANAKADVAAERARAIALGLKTDKASKKTNPFANAATLLDCYGKKRSLCELILVEGKSAGSGLATNRNVELQAILPLRGKIINSEKSGLKALENQEVKAFFQALGCGILNQYKKKDLRYGKVIIATDSDSDGSHITVLLLTLIKNYCIDLVSDGIVYLAVPPKYEAVDKKGNVVFIKDDNELASIQNKVSRVHGLKGLGSMNSGDLYSSTLDPENRTLIQISPKNIDDFIKNIEDYMGTDVKARKELALSLEKKKK